MAGTRTFWPAVAVLVVAGIALPQAASVDRAGERMGTEMVRVARQVLQGRDLTTADIDLAVALAEAAGELAPESALIWRSVRDIAAVAEEDQLGGRAVATIVALDSDDEQARLLRLRQAVERFQRVDRRVQALEAVLTPEAIDAIGPAVASRLGGDLADLHRRNGDQTSMGRWLEIAVELDPSNTEAVAALGGFRSGLDDSAAVQAQSLISMLLANPADPSVQASLGSLLLETGAYEAAERMLTLAVETQTVVNEMVDSSLLADLAMAQWATGDDKAALKTIANRQAEIDRMYRQMTSQDQPRLSPVELARLNAPLEPLLSTVRAVILSESDDPDESARGVDLAIDSFRVTHQLTDLEEATDARQASVVLQAAILLYWLGSRTENAGALVQSADQITPLTTEARQRFNGLAAWRVGDLEGAVDQLTPLAFEDSIAGACLGAVELQRGDRQGAAVQFLLTARAFPGTLAGIWSMVQLKKILGQEVPPGETAEALEMIVARVSTHIDRYPTEPRLAVSVRLRPRSKVLDPYEPVLLDISIMNMGTVPLAIGPEAPINSLVALIVNLQVPYMQLPPPEPIIVDIGQRLSLLPRQELVVSIDLRGYWPAALLDLHPLRGASFSVKGILNFRASISANPRNPAFIFSPGPLGSEVKSENFRVDGVRLSPAWLSSAVASVLDRQDVAAMVMISHAVTLAGEQDAVTVELGESLLQEAVDAVTSTFPTLPLSQRAWFVAMMSESDDLDPLWMQAGVSGEPLLSLASLWRYMDPGHAQEALDDPVFVAGLDSPSELVAGMARWIEDRINERAQGELTAPVQEP